MSLSTGLRAREWRIGERLRWITLTLGLKQTAGGPLSCLISEPGAAPLQDMDQTSRLKLGKHDSSPVPA